MNNLADQPVRAVPKPSFGRNKPKRRTLSELSVKEVARLRLRSNGVCERCDSHRATEKAHVERRWNSTKPPTAEDVIDLCKWCHTWADSCLAGRKWMRSFQKAVINKAKAQ
jgi:hypothetical protein